MCRILEQQGRGEPGTLSLPDKQLTWVELHCLDCKVLTTNEKFASHSSMNWRRQSISCPSNAKIPRVRDPARTPTVRPPGMRPQHLLQRHPLAGRAAQPAPHRHRQQLLLAVAQPLIVGGKLVAVQSRAPCARCCSRGGRRRPCCAPAAATSQRVHSIDRSRAHQERRGGVSTGGGDGRQWRSMCGQQLADAVVFCGCDHRRDLQLRQVPAGATTACSSTVVTAQGRNARHQLWLR